MSDKEFNDVSEELKNALPPKSPADDADEILGEIMGKGGSYNESFHSMMNKYLGVDGAFADPDEVDTGRIFRRHVDESLERHISVDSRNTAERGADERIRKKLAPSVRDVYVSEDEIAPVRPSFTPDGSVVYPGSSGDSGERVVYDADWEKQAKAQAGKIDEMRRSGVTTAGTNLGSTFRFAGNGGEDQSAEPKTGSASRSSGAASRVSHEDFLTPVIGAPEPEKVKKETRSVRPLAENEAETLTNQEKEQVENAVLELFSPATDADKAFREKWADTVSKAQKRKEKLEEENKKENARLRSEEKQREKEQQVAASDYRWVSSERGSRDPNKTIPEVRFQPRQRTDIPDESDFVERIAVDDTPEAMIYKKGKGEKLAFSMKSKFSKEGVKRFFRSVFPGKGDSGGEKARKVFRLAMFLVMIGALVVFVLTFTPWFKMHSDNKHFTDEIESLENLTPDEQAEMWVQIRAQYPDVDFPEGMNVKFAYRYAMNQDVVGMVSIEGLGLNTVLVQSDDNDFYLYRDMYKQKSRYGTPYVKSDSRMGKDGFSKNIIIYGHNTHDGLIFNILERYAKTAQTLRDYPIVTLDTLYETTKWKIFAVMLTNADPADDNGKAFDFLYSDFFSNTHFMYVVNGMKERSMIHTGVDVNENDHILTLYTCYRYQFDSGRLVIVARQIRDGESEEINKNAVYYDDNAYFPAAYYGEPETTAVTTEPTSETTSETPATENESVPEALPDTPEDAGATEEAPPPDESEAPDDSGQAAGEPEDIE